MDRLAPHENVALKAIRTLEDLPQHRIYKQIEEMNRQSALIEAAQNAMAKPAIYEAVEAAQRRAADMQRLVDRAVLPHQSSILEMAEKAAKVTAPFESSWTCFMKVESAVVLFFDHFILYWACIADC